MKKTLLTIVAALVATVSYGQPDVLNNKTSKNLWKLDKTEIVQISGAFKDFTTKHEAMNAFYADKITYKIAQKDSKRAPEEEIILTPAYSIFTYHYTDVAGGFFPKNMYDGASFLVEDGKAYLAPFKNLGYVEGVIEADVQNRYSSYGADSITFIGSVIAHNTDEESGTSVSLVLEPCKINNYVPSRLGKKEFGAYYFAEDNELYIPASTTLALFEEDASKTEIFSPYYVARSLDLQPQSDFDNYIYKGTCEATRRSNGATAYEPREALILKTSSSYYVKGADVFNQNAWIKYELNEDDSKAKVSKDQYVGGGTWYTDSNHTTTFDADLATVGATDASGSLAWTEDFSSSYSVTQARGGNIVIENEDNVYYGLYMYANPSSYSSVYTWVTQKITVTNELATSINTVKDDIIANGAMFNLAGQRVAEGYKGLVIKNGKKYVVK